MPETVWVCHPRFRWYPQKSPGCTGFRKGHEACGWYQLEQTDAPGDE